MLNNSNQEVAKVKKEKKTAEELLNKRQIMSISSQLTS